MKERLKTTELKAYREKNTPKKCPILKIPIPPSKAVVDHDHETGHVRGVLHKHSNALLGKIENYHRCYLKPLGIEWDDLKGPLQRMVDWGSKSYFENPIHPNGTKKQVARFKALPSKNQIAFLRTIDVEPGKNSLERTKQFREFLFGVKR